VSEWATFLEDHVASLELPRGLEEGAARDCMQSCVESTEITSYQAFHIMRGFLDNEKRGYS